MNVQELIDKLHGLDQKVRDYDVVVIGHKCRDCVGDVASSVTVKHKEKAIEIA